MALTPETLLRHELNGLPVRVVEAANPDLVGIAGRVVVETMQTVHVDCGAEYPCSDVGGDDSVELGGSRVRQVPKRGVTLEFALTAGEPEFADDVSSANRSRTNEAAGSRRQMVDEASAVRRRRKAPGSTFKQESETAGVRPGQSGSTGDGSPATDGRGRSSASGDCQNVVYVTVDGAQLLSRPAHRTETTGDSKWR